MDPVIELVLWLMGLALAIVLIVAQCQLFAIRRTLEAMLRLQFPQDAQRALNVGRVQANVDIESTEHRQVRERSNRVLYFFIGLGVVALIAVLLAQMR